MIFINMLKWYSFEKKLLKNFDIAKDHFSAETLSKLHSIISSSTRSSSKHIVPRHVKAWYIR